MRELEFAEIRLRVEPEIIYRDEHSEYGETQYFRTKVYTTKEVSNASKLAENFVDSIVKKHYFDELYKEFNKMLVPANEDTWKKDIIEIHFHVYGSYSGRFVGEELIEKDFYEKYVRSGLSRKSF